MKHFRPFLVSLLCAALTACHSPGQAQTAQAQESQVSTVQTQNSPAAPVSRSSARQVGTDPASGLAWMNISSLPTQGQQTYRLILAGGPFPYSRDGVVFQNRERILPGRSRGTYHEYTVKTPGSSDRGARRIICAALPECYYTEDHYSSFRRIHP
ncbi:ribonuclease domain-containing protein [Deinococcus radiomollis]|uniref:ribonuclease domain-containing protein n=1 Tax=Deinococcus radiomollis TaxID=468916 RepID=UPI00389134BC